MWLCLIPILIITVLLPLLFSYVDAISVNKSFFSVNVSDNWAYLNVELKNGGDYNSSMFLIPIEFGDMLINSNGDYQKSLQNVGASSLMTLDSVYLFRNVPLEIYAQSHINQSKDKILSKENTTIDGEKALKIHRTIKDNLTNFDEGVDYYVFHDANPYRIHYFANAKDFQKYLPEFEQMVKTFKFVK